MTAITAKPTSLWPLVVEKLKADPNFIPLCVDVLKAGLAAEVKHYSKEAKDWVATPDARARIDTLKLILAYDEGMPLQRVFQATFNQGGVAKSVEELARSITESPELSTAFRRELERAERQKEKPAIPAG